MPEGPTLVEARAPDRAPGEERPTRRPRILLPILLLTLAAGVLTAFSALPMLRAGGELRAGRSLLTDARDALVAGDASSAASSFAAAEEAFGRAEGHSGSVLIRLGGLVPIVGRTYDAVGGLADVGTRAASAGRTLADAVDGLPGGLGSLAPAGGRIPVDRMVELLPAVVVARADLEAAREAADRIATSYVAPPLASAAATARAEVADALSSLRTADALLDALPTFLGDDGVRRYFVAAQSPAELRGTGGFIGSFAILTARDGRVSLGPFHEISVLRDLPPEAVPAPSDAFRELYDRFGGAGFWRNVNMTPDAPTAASAIETLYERVEGTRLDGTIFVTPQTLAELLEATGPVEAPLLDRTLTAGDIVDYLTRDAYEEFGYRAPLRKRLLGIAVGDVFERFLRGDEPDAALRALVDAGGNGSLFLHAADPGIQRAFAAAGVAGELGAPGGDVFGLFTTDASATKVDHYVRRRVRYEVTLGAEGAASADATIRFANRAPRGAEPSYAMGPYPGTGLEVGEELSFASIYCARGCELTGATEDDAPAGLEVHREAGLRSLHRYIRVPAGDERSLKLSLRIRRAWSGDTVDGVYRLRLQAQATVHPTAAEVLVRVPEGMRVVATNLPMEVRDAEAVWRGPVTGNIDLEVRFRRPLAGRLWRALWG